MIKKVSKNIVYKIKQDNDFFESKNMKNSLRYNEELLNQIRFLPTSKINKNRIDKEYIKLLIKCGFYYFDYLPEEIKKDKEIIEYAIDVKSVFIFTYMDKEIKKDRNYLEKCLEINNFIAVNNLSEEIINDEKYIIYLIKKNKNYAIFPALPKKIRYENYNIQRAAIEQNISNVILIETPETIGKKIHTNSKISIIKKNLQKMGA